MHTPLLAKHPQYQALARQHTELLQTLARCGLNAENQRKLAAISGEMAVIEYTHGCLQDEENAQQAHLKLAGSL